MFCQINEALEVEVKIMLKESSRYLPIYPSIESFTNYLDEIILIFYAGHKTTKKGFQLMSRLFEVDQIHFQLNNLIESCKIILTRKRKGRSHQMGAKIWGPVKLFVQKIAKRI